MKFNWLDGDRAAEAYDESNGKKDCARILDAFNLGQSDSSEGRPYNNIFNKKHQRFKYIAYKNGYFGIKK
jgi:hypothetical protein